MSSLLNGQHGELLVMANGRGFTGRTQGYGESSKGPSSNSDAYTQAMWSGEGSGSSRISKHN